MYRCQLCGTVVPKGTAKQVIVKKSLWQHPHRRGVIRKIVLEKGRRQEKWADDPGGVGPQILTETPVCSACLQKHTA